MAALVVAGGDGAKVLQAVDGALDDIAALVGLRIESGRTAAARTAGQPVGLSVLALGADAPNAATLHELAWLACAVSAIDAYAWRALPGAARTEPGHGDGIEHGLELADIGTLARRHQQ